MQTDYLGEIIRVLPLIPEHHAPGDPLYALLKKLARREVEHAFSSEETVPHQLGDLGEIVFPYFSMGAVDSRNLFDLDELIIFAFYLRNRTRYSNVADIGANIGLHSVLLAKCGMHVRAFEPDPVHFRALQQRLELNHCSNVEAFNCAVSGESGEMEFVRVVGNTTGSHLAGSKPNPYGKLEHFPVKVEGIATIIDWADLLKLDAEGHETHIILATRREQWQKTDAFIEVENAENAAILYEHFKKLGVAMFTQKSGWRRVQALGDLPTSYKDGMMFVSATRQTMWE